MTKVERIKKIETEIERLSKEELSALRKWLREYDAAAWDREIEEDAAAGRLDALLEEARGEHRRGRTTPL